MGGGEERMTRFISTNMHRMLEGKTLCVSSISGQ